jgi:hypothetical protein
MMEASVLSGRTSLKRFLLIIPVILFILLNACGSPTVTPEQGTATAQAQTASMGTATLAPTADVLSSLIFSELNREIESLETSTKFSQLEHIHGASYQVTGVSFPVRRDGTLIFHVQTRCECAENAQCCSPTHTLVVTMMVMDDIQGTLVTQIPPTVTVLEVWCYDHANLTEVMSVPWGDVKNFFLGYIDGFQLESKVTPAADP